jgi:hypothetical protein
MSFIYKSQEHTNVQIKVKKLTLYYFLIKINLIFWIQAWYPAPPDVQLLSTKVRLLQKFLDPQKHALIDNILPICVKNKPRRIEKRKKIDVNFHLNVLFRICMSLIPLQATCHFTFNKSGYTFPFEYTHFSIQPVIPGDYQLMREKKNNTYVNQSKCWD